MCSFSKRTLAYKTGKGRAERAFKNIKCKEQCKDKQGRARYAEGTFCQRSGGSSSKDPRNLTRNWKYCLGFNAHQERCVRIGVGKRRICRQFRRILNKKKTKDFNYIILARQNQVRRKVPKAPSPPTLGISSSIADTVTWTGAGYFLQADEGPCRAQGLRPQTPVD